MAAIANSVAQKIILKTLEPNYTVSQFGSLDAASAVTSTQAIPSGPTFGFYKTFPEIEKDNSKKGWSLGNRESPTVHVNGISIQGFLVLPATQSAAVVQMYFGTTKRPSSTTDSSQPVVDESVFTCPDTIDNVRHREPEAEKLRKIYWSKRMKLTHGGNWKSLGDTSNHEVIADKQVPFKKYFKFKKPIQISYDSNVNNSFNGRRFFLCFKSHTADPSSTAGGVKMVAKVTTYYRDD